MLKIECNQKKSGAVYSLVVGKISVNTSIMIATMYHVGLIMNFREREGFRNGSSSWNTNVRLCKTVNTVLADCLLSMKHTLKKQRMWPHIHGEYLYY